MASLADEEGSGIRLWRLLTERSPGRFAFAARLALICALTAVVAEVYQTPEIALTIYIAFFLNKADRVSSMALTIALTIFATIVLSFLFLIASPVLANPSLRVGTMAGVSFCLLFLVSASKLKPVGSDVALVIAYALDVLGSAPFGELATRALLYAWLFVGIPAGVSAVVNLILAPSPLKILLRELALRLRTAGQALQGDTEAISQVRKLTAEGDAELQFQLKLSVIEHSSRRADLDALQGATDCVVAVLSAVQLMVSERDALPSRATREQMTHKLFELAQIFERNAYPAQVEPISNKEEESDLARSGIGLFNVGLKHFGKIMPAELPRKKEKSGFLATDAFTNPEHVDFAVKTTAAAMLCYLIYTLLGWPGIHTAFITCYIVSLGTVGETVQKLTLRILGCLVGVGLGLFVMIGIIPRVTGIGHLALIVFGGVFIAAWVAVGSPQISYAGFQMAFAFLLCVVQGPSPSFDMVIARDRVIGVLLGNFLSYLVATRLWPRSVGPRIDRAIETATQQLEAIVRSSDQWHRNRLFAETSTLLNGVEDDIQLAAYEPESIRPTRASLSLRLDVVHVAQSLQTPLLAASETFDDRSRQGIIEMFQGKQSEEQRDLSLARRTGRGAHLKELIVARSNLFREALRRLHQAEEHA
ncbi:MAG TPA: FUSC family protein [Candidatus Limnocylindrales bacterium]|nr:FUSC family protein [Candidatus Limnocylindrales bacterium]